MTLGKMSQRLIVLVCWLALVGVSRTHPQARPANGITFDETDPGLIRLGNDHYEIGIHKHNGGIATILDKGSGQRVSEGSRGECLWGSILVDDAGVEQYLGGCNYGGDDPLRTVDYEWDEAEQRLTVRYLTLAPRRPEIDVWVDITPSECQWFDVHLFLENRSDEVVDRVLMPSDLVFLQDDIQEGLVPVMPGIVFKSSFFGTFLSSEGGPGEYTVMYPGWPGVFADYLAIKSTKGAMALYSIAKEDETVSTRLGFVYDDADPPYIENSIYVAHTFYPAIAHGVGWDSPMVRVHIGQDYPATLAAYRQHNHIDALPGLAEKLGARYEQTAQSPIIKVDVDKPIDDYQAALDVIPSPAILHWVSYWEPSFDENYPDFLPPRDDWASIGAMASLFRLANAHGFLNMPYTNPTWWDDESPTLQGQDITSTAVIRADGTPKYECYTGSADAPPCSPQNASRASVFNQAREPYEWLHGGYAVSPYAPVVQQRLAQLMHEMTALIPSDLVFQDQIGAANRGYDDNVHSPSVTSYLDGWIAHTETYSNSLLMTEMGYDRLIAAEVGLNGSTLLAHRQGHTAGWWGDANWHPYPLVTMVARDKVLFYQHNLAPETFTFDKETLAWNLAMGYMLSYDLNGSEYGGGLDSAWLKVVNLVQEQVLSEYAGERVTGFRMLQDGVTQTRFEKVTVIANWKESAVYHAGGHGLAPGGVIVFDDRNTLSAGVFSTYNGLALTTGDHILVEKRENETITLWQPIGDDTPIALAALPGWADDDLVLVAAYNETDRRIAQSAATVTDGTITFTYRSDLDGANVAY
ncbi:MAG: hypothetical protein JXA89_05435, partial [Anaerolineae bacterium]|nr:hypothetical protein [Anaerolineae bacterium]